MKSKNREVVLKIGMLWFDNNEEKDPYEIFSEAAGHYFERYGHTPELCHVHPNMFDNREEAINII